MWTSTITVLKDNKSSHFPFFTSPLLYVHDSSWELKGCTIMIYLRRPKTRHYGVQIYFVDMWSLVRSLLIDV